MSQSMDDNTLRHFCIKYNIVTDNAKSQKICVDKRTECDKIKKQHKV